MENDDLLFQIFDTDILLKITSGKLNAVYLAKKELADRGLDKNGKWTGFEKAYEIHGIKKQNS